MGSADFDHVPVTHRVSDPEFGNAVEHRHVDTAQPDDPIAGATTQLLYDHLAFLQAEALERRGATLSIEVRDEDSLTLQLVATRVLAGR